MKKEMPCGVIVYRNLLGSYILVEGKRVPVILAKNTSEFRSFGLCHFEIVKSGKADAMVAVCRCGNFNSVGKLEGDDSHNY
jgi:hypothetical protein